MRHRHSLVVFGLIVVGPLLLFVIATIVKESRSQHNLNANTDLIVHAPTPDPIKVEEDKLLQKATESFPAFANEYIDSLKRRAIRDNNEPLAPLSPLKLTMSLKDIRVNNPERFQHGIRSNFMFTLEHVIDIPATGGQIPCFKFVNISCQYRYNQWIITNIKEW